MNVVVVQLHPRCRRFRCTYLLITDSCRTDFVRKKGVGVGGGGGGGDGFTYVINNTGDVRVT